MLRHAATRVRSRFRPVGRQAIHDSAPTTDRFATAFQIAVRFQSMKHRINAAFTKLQHLLARLFDGSHQLVPVHGPPRQQLQHE